MPHLLRYDAIRLLEGSTEALHIAISSLGAKKRTRFRQPAAEHAVEIGLIGTAAELAMASMLVQAWGPSSILWPSGLYKTAGAILDEFRKLLRDATPACDFLTQDVDNPTQHREELLKKITQFKRLIPIRGAAFHAGKGLVHEATVYQASLVSEFLEQLAESKKIRPYLEHIPRCSWYKIDRTLIIEDLTRRLSNGIGDQISNLASLYLVLPDVPEDKPEWLDAFSRLTICPRDRDVSFLLDVLESALPASLRRTTQSGAAVSVKICPGDPSALPIQPQHLHRKFNEISDLWHSDVATANGRLEAGSLDLPPIDAIREVFAFGLEHTGILQHNSLFTAHESWPSIASGLTTQGTEGPIWFLIRKTSDLGQLTSILKTVSELCNRTQKLRFQNAIVGIESLRNNTAYSHEYCRELIAEIANAADARKDLYDRVKASKGTIKEFPACYSDQLFDVCLGGQPIGSLLVDLITSTQCSLPSAKYWVNKLASATEDNDDLAALVIILASDEFKNAHTTARKAIRRIDFKNFGPST